MPKQKQVDALRQAFVGHICWQGLGDSLHFGKRKGLAFVREVLITESRSANDYIKHYSFRMHAK